MGGRMRYELTTDNTIKDKYTDVTYDLPQITDLLNRMYRESTITTNDIRRCVELKAVNRMLRMENRFLTIKLHQLAWQGMVDIKQIENELQELCINPQEVSDYIHEYEKENYELKQKLKQLGDYVGNVL